MDSERELTLNDYLNIVKRKFPYVVVFFLLAFFFFKENNLLLQKEEKAVLLLFYSRFGCILFPN